MSFCMAWTFETRINPTRKNPPAEDQLRFGKFFADHMFTARFQRERGWYQAAVEPYAPFAMDPAASCLHYGQALFEGLKAFRQKDGSVAVFRPEFNWQRMVQGAERLCMEMPPLELWNEGLMKLLQVCENFVPKNRGTALYVRPTLIATEPFLGVRPSNEYLFYIILSPVASYYSHGTGPIKIWVEKEYLRAAPGGLGATKAAANYAASLKAAVVAKDKGYAQVLWLDTDRVNVQEVGTMNVFFVIGDEVVTPVLDGAILEGGTRKAVLEILRRKGYKTTERKISHKELRDAAQAGRLTEAFGTGTAAVITPIGELSSDDFQLHFKEEAPVSKLLYDELTGIHYGEKPDEWKWMKKI